MWQGPPGKKQRLLRKVLPFRFDSFKGRYTRLRSPKPSAERNGRSLFPQLTHAWPACQVRVQTAALAQRQSGISFAFFQSSCKPEILTSKPKTRFFSLHTPGKALPRYKQRLQRKVVHEWAAVLWDKRARVGSTLWAQRKIDSPGGQLGRRNLLRVCVAAKWGGNRVCACLRKWASLFRKRLLGVRLKFHGGVR